MVKSPELGVGVCIHPDCNARVMYWVNRAGAVFYSCRGKHDPQGKFCGDRHDFGPEHSAQIKQKFGEKKDVGISENDGDGTGSEREASPERGFAKLFDFS